jgi:hypothetical protein
MQEHSSQYVAHTVVRWWYGACLVGLTAVQGLQSQLDPFPVLYGELALTLREKQSFPSATGFPECQKSGTRGSQSSPSVALGEELHSGKVAFPECLNGHGTWGRPALGEGHLPPAQHSGKTGARKRKVAFDGNIRRSRLKKIEKTLPRVPSPSTRGR